MGKKFLVKAWSNLNQYNYMVFHFSNGVFPSQIHLPQPAANFLKLASLPQPSKIKHIA